MPFSSLRSVPIAVQPCQRPAPDVQTPLEEVHVASPVAILDFSTGSTPAGDGALRVVKAARSACFARGIAENQVSPENLAARRMHNT